MVRRTVSWLCILKQSPFYSLSHGAFQVRGIGRGSQLRQGAAIDVEHLAGHERGLIAGKVKNGVGNVGRLAVRTWSQNSSVISKKWAIGEAQAALLTRMSTVPKAFRVWSNSWATSAALLTSARTASTRFVVARSACSACRSLASSRSLRI